MEEKKKFRISEIDQMTKDDLSPNDLFLVSDAKDENKNSNYVTKSLSYGDLSISIEKNVVKSPEIKQDIKNEICSNIDEYVPIQNWYDNGTDIPDQLSSDNFQIILNCGDSKQLKGI